MILLRPEFLLLIFLWLPLLWFAARAQQRSAWQQVIDATLLKAFNQLNQDNKRWSYALLALVLTLITLALSGPALTHGVKATASQGNLYVVLDNSLSMAATDVAPDRITRAKRMIFDWTRSGLFDKTTVVTYSGSAHTVTPLTSDVATLEVQLQPLTPFVMPNPGNRAELAFEKINEALAENSAEPVHLLWLTDDIETQKMPAIRKALPEFSSATAVAIGTLAGSPIPLSQGQGNLIYQNEVVIVQTDAQDIAQKAQQLGFTIQPLGAQPQAQFFNNLNRSEQQQAGISDIGFWLLVPILLLWLFTTKYQHITALAVVFLLSQTPNTSFAFDLFKNSEQQAFDLLAEQPEKSLALSNSPRVQAQAQFQLNDFAAAADTLKQEKDIDAQFNRANALVHAGKLKEALELYDEVLQQAEHEGALKNRKLVDSFLKNQPDQEGQQDGDQQQDSDQQQPSEQNQSSENSQQQESEQNQQQEQETEQNSASEEESEQEQTEQQAAEQDSEQAEETEQNLSREDQLSESILNQLQAPSGSILQNKFELQHRNNPMEADSTLW